MVERIFNMYEVDFFLITVFSGFVVVFILGLLYNNNIIALLKNILDLNFFLTLCLCVRKWKSDKCICSFT